MKQGDKSIIGLWKWSENAIYEKGDFVVKGENIYRVVSDVQGVDPDSNRGNGKYELYPGTKIKTKEEYEKIINNSETTKDQYVSSSALDSILKGIYFGLDSNGIIDSTIDVDDENNIKTSEDISLQPGKDILDDLLNAPEYNNGSIKVSKNLESIKDLVGRPDDSDITPRNGAKWITCNRDPESPCRCRKCWECVRVCQRVHKTYDNELVIEDGPSDNVESISEAQSESFVPAVNICPYRALSYTTDPEVAKFESQRYETVVTGGGGGTIIQEPDRELIVFGAKTKRVVVQEQSGSTSSWVFESEETITHKNLIGIIIDGRVFDRSSQSSACEEIQDHISRYLHFNCGILSSKIIWYANTGQELPTFSDITTERMIQEDKKQISIYFEEYNEDIIRPTSLCVLEYDPSNSEDTDQLRLGLGQIVEDIQKAYDPSLGDPSICNWKLLIGTAAQIPDLVYRTTGAVKTTTTTYKREINTDYITVYKTRSLSKKACGYIDCLDLICRTIGGDAYNECRITQSSITSEDNVLGSEEHDWTSAKTRRYPSKWTTSLYPVSGKTRLIDYPIGKYWEWWVTNENGDHDDQRNFFTGWNENLSRPYDYAVYYNLTSNIFCVKIPEACIKFLNASSLSDEAKSSLLTSLQTILSNSGFGSHENPGEVFNVSNSLIYGGLADLDALYSAISEYAYCDYVFNVTFGRFDRNTYIRGSQEFISSVENKLRDHQYYYKLDKAESSVGDELVFDGYTICTNLEEWQGYESETVHQHGTEGSYSFPCQYNEGPGLALLPRMLYSEWQDLSLSMSLESEELVGENNSNLLLVPRWMSEGGNTPITSGLTYTDSRVPFWTELYGEEAAEIADSSGIDNSVKWIADYYKRNFFITNPDSYAILKQYSYYSKNTGELLRVQELIDPEYGEMFIRSTNQQDWKPCLVNFSNTARKMTRLLSTLDTFKHGYNTRSVITNQTYGTSCFSSWKHDTGWALPDARLSRHFCVKQNVDNEIYIVLIKDVDGKLHNITIATVPNSVVSAVYNFTSGKLEVKYSGSQVYLICSYGADIVDIYYGK